uniref:Uncharacterized protein n=1 Tax=Populus trichocarpa TaxID=3694 RepID=A0A2K2CBW6_POPTR
MFQFSGGNRENKRNKTTKCYLSFKLKTVVWYWKFLFIIIMIRGVISSMFQLPMTFELWIYRILINS